MSALPLEARFRELAQRVLPMPGKGATAERHRAIFEAGREDLSLAKLIEAHWDALSILDEAGREPASGAAYAVWASELPGQPVTFEGDALYGKKEFCSGAALVDRALVTAGPYLVEIDLRAAGAHLDIDESVWQPIAFRPTRTASLFFRGVPVVAVVGRESWYTQRRGFWPGACGPAAAWGGGAAGLVASAFDSKRDDAHTLAHLAAMEADTWAIAALLASAGDALDAAPQGDGITIALRLRHLVEQLCTDVLRRFARAMGPAPLVKDAEISRRYAELDLFLRQSHAERDLEALGRALRRPAAASAVAG